MDLGSKIFRMFLIGAIAVAPWFGTAVAAVMTDDVDPPALVKLLEDNDEIETNAENATDDDCFCPSDLNYVDCDDQNCSVAAFMSLPPAISVDLALHPIGLDDSAVTRRPPPEPSPPRTLV